jgi:F-type H+-transporting ATPase subunit alpha
VLKQPQYQPVPVNKQVVILYAAGNGYLDPVDVEHVRDFETGLYQFLETRRPDVLTTLADKKALDDDLKKALDAALKEYQAQFLAGRKAA